MKSFSRLDNLRQHCQTVHSESPEQNEEMLRRLTALHSSLAASAAKNQQAYARVVRRPTASTHEEPESLLDSSLNHDNVSRRGRTQTDPLPRLRRDSLPKATRSRSDVFSTAYPSADKYNARVSAPLSTSPVLQGTSRPISWNMNSFRAIPENYQSGTPVQHFESPEISPLDKPSDRPKTALPNPQAHMAVRPARQMVPDMRHSWSSRGDGLPCSSPYDLNSAAAPPPVVSPADYLENTDMMRSSCMSLRPPLPSVSPCPLPPLVALDRLRQDSDVQDHLARSGREGSSGGKFSSASISYSPYHGEMEPKLPPFFQRWSVAGFEMYPHYRAGSAARMSTSRTYPGWSSSAPTCQSPHTEYYRLLDTSRKRKANDDS